MQTLPFTYHYSRCKRGPRDKQQLNLEQGEGKALNGTLIATGSKRNSLLRRHLRARQGGTRDEPVKEERVTSSSRRNA